MANIEKKTDKPRKGRSLHPIRYIKETMGELKKVSWPTGKELVSHTGAVFAFLILMVAIIFVLDLLFGGAVDLLIKIGS